MNKPGAFKRRVDWIEPAGSTRPHLGEPAAGHPRGVVRVVPRQPRLDPLRLVEHQHVADERVVARQPRHGEDVRHAGHVHGAVRGLQLELEQDGGGRSGEGRGEEKSENRT